jgi:hypothetical protein
MTASARSPFLNPSNPDIPAVDFAARRMCSPSTGEMEVPFSARFLLGRSGRNPDGRLVEGLQMSRPDSSFDDTAFDDTAFDDGLPAAADHPSAGGDLPGVSADGESIAAGGGDTPMVGDTSEPPSLGTTSAKGTAQADSPSGRHFPHLPVMVREVAALLAPIPAGVVLDATVGGGGHARAIL